MRTNNVPTRAAAQERRRTEAAQRQAAFDALPASEKLLRRSQKATNNAKKRPAPTPGIGSPCPTCGAEMGEAPNGIICPNCTEERISG